MDTSSAHRLNLIALDGAFAVCRLAPDTAAIPAWATAGPWYAVTRTADELSIVCPAAQVPGEVRAEHGWRMLRLTGPFPFELTGILAAVLAPLATAAIPIFALSTYDTDYVLVKAHDLGRAVAALRAAGHRVEPGEQAPPD
jgi:hypothetical protein